MAFSYSKQCTTWQVTFHFFSLQYVIVHLVNCAGISFFFLVNFQIFSAFGVQIYTLENIEFKLCQSITVLPTQILNFINLKRFVVVVVVVVVIFVFLWWWWYQWFLIFFFTGNKLSKLAKIAIFK